MSYIICFKTTTDEAKTVIKIAKRALAMMVEHRAPRDRRTLQDIEMDIVATHKNGCPLRLDDLLAADDFNFAHDVFGIERHLNRENGKLENCFLPRLSDPKARRKAAA